ncbi:MAG: hypothetical protein Q9198_000747 [Flavoplaca austrocitrina]
MYSIAYLLIPNLFSTIAYAAPQIVDDEKGPILNCGRGDKPLTTLCTDHAYTCDFTTFELISPAVKLDDCSYVSTLFRFPRSITHDSQPRTKPNYRLFFFANILSSMYSAPVNAQTDHPSGTGHRDLLPWMNFELRILQIRDRKEPPKNGEPLTPMPNHSAPQDPHPADSQSQPGGEAAPAGGQEPVLPESSYLPAPAEENAKGPDGEDCHVWNGRLASNPLFAEGKKMALPCN